MHVVGVGLRSYQNYRFTNFALLSSRIGVKDGHASGRAWGGVEPHGQQLARVLGLLDRLWVKTGMQELIHLLRRHPHQGFFFGDQALVDHVHGDLDRSRRSPLARAGLEHPQLALLDGEFHILHVVIMVLQQIAKLQKQLVVFGEFLLHFGDLTGGANAGHHVLSLGVHQILAVELVLASGGVAGEGHAGAAALAHVAKDHGHHVDGGAPVVGQALSVAIGRGRCAEPGVKHSGNGLAHLLVGIVGEVLAQLFLVQRFEVLDHLLEHIGGQVGVLAAFGFGLALVQDVLKGMAIHTLDNVAEHLDETTVGIPGEALVAGQLDHALERVGVEADVEHGIHHARHGDPRPRATGDQQRVGRIAKLFASLFFNLFRRL